MKKVAWLLPLLGLSLACNKNGAFPAVGPEISFQSMNGNVVPNGGTLVITLGFKDRKGDIQDTMFLSKFISGQLSYSDLPYPIPKDVPQTKNLQGQIVLTLGYITDIGQPQNNHPDTAVFQMYMKDLAGHSSDTVNTPPVIIMP